MSDKDLYSGMIRLHILYHASKEPIFGLSIIEELGRHGYKLSPGTLYPILLRLHDEGWLEAKWEPSREQGRPPRHLYRITAAGSSETKKIFQLAAAKSRTQRLAYES